METTKGKNLPLSKRAASFETVMWFYTRFSALAMYAFILVGFIAALIVSAQTHANLADILRWAFLPNTVANPLSVASWVSVLVKLMVTAFILVLSAHGVHGIVAIAYDYLVPSTGQQIFRNLIIAFFVVVNAITIYVIWIL